MKIYFDNPEYDGQFLRAVDHAPLSAQIGEAWTKKKRSTPNAQRPMSEIRGQRSMPSRVIGEQQSVNKEENVQPCSAKPATQGEEGVQLRKFSRAGAQRRISGGEAYLEF